MNTLTEARHNLARYFRSVHIAVVTSGDPEGIGPCPAALARWLDEYQQAYLAAHEGHLGAALHPLQGRTMTLEGAALLQNPAALAQLGESTRRGGLVTVLALPLDAMLARPQAVAELTQAFPGAQVRIDCRALNGTLAHETLQARISALKDCAQRSGTLTLVGDVALLQAAGFFADESFNSIFAAQHALPQAGVRHHHRAREYSPCRDFIAWFIDAAGEIYPCAGMAGHSAARFGSIHEPFDHLIDALAYSAPRIEALARQGPHPLGEGAESPADLCALHRQRVHGIATL